MAKVLWLVAGFAGVAVIASTYSRGAMLGLGVALVMLPLWRRSARGIATMIAAIVLIGLVVAQTSVGHHASSLYASGQLDVSASERVHTWTAVLQSAVEHPFGLGFNGWPRASRASADVGLLDPPATIGAPHPAENQWMRELADRGVLGVLMLALLVAGIIRATFRGANVAGSSGYTRDLLAAVGAANVGWVFVLLTGDHLTYDSVAGIFWYTAGLALAATRSSLRPVASEAGTSFVVLTSTGRGR